MFQLLVTAYVSVPGRGLACDTEVIIFDSTASADLAADKIADKNHGGEVQYSIVKMYD